MAVAFGRGCGFASGRAGGNWTPDGTLRSEGEAHFSLSWAHEAHQKSTLYEVVFQKLPSLSRATPSAVSEHSSELIGYPISRSLTTCCVRLELRSLPSPGVTRLQRYCGPLRLPTAPGLSLAGVRLIVPDHTLGSPVLRALSLCTCCRHYPGAAAGRTTSLVHPDVSAFPEMVVGSACASSFSRCYGAAARKLHPSSLM